MASSLSPEPPTLPFPIFRHSQTLERYLLYDIDTITWLRATHHILGVLIGTLPQFPQQNVFLGLPLELMPEEARLLVEKGIAYTVDDLAWHNKQLGQLTDAQKLAFLQELEREGGEAAKAAERKKTGRSEEALKNNRRDCGGNASTIHALNIGSETAAEEVDNEGGESLFASPSAPQSSTPIPPSSSEGLNDVPPWAITPTKSYPPLALPTPSPSSPLPTVNPATYALFSHLHGLGYFMSPGLRFGCQLLVYPGDPLRFHSHFLAVGAAWDEEINLLDLVGGGRLGTGVKKGWLIGGVKGDEYGDGDESVESSAGKDANGDSRLGAGIDHDGRGRESNIDGARVRTFCIEWGGM
ncbi:tRNA-splicing endonuclease, SEN34 subunit [Lasallia pustulata]|uniref:tRNA-splicing endonuclease subunit Sen34 n=1 Tax=Lasallia pustulata TaxID=136370 RepID=A0A1W5DB82_9LECA|nr:tRNA-splicing endonuclease, SEN34 subunit [Lasallia pustulata]